jgi:hypothetical protein
LDYWVTSFRVVLLDCDSERCLLNHENQEDIMEMCLQALRAKVRGFQAAGISIHRRIVKSSGLKRNSLWQQKRALGDWNRIHLIAYGLLRGIPYEKIEKCAKVNQPFAQSVFDVMSMHANWQVKRELTLDKVKILLGQEPNLLPVEKRETLVASLQALLKPTEKWTRK